MLSLLAVLAFSQQTVPPELTLPIKKAVPLREGLGLKLPEPARRDIRGCVVADDGSAVFWGRDSLSIIDFQAGTYVKSELFWRRWLPDEPPITSTQRAFLDSINAVPDTFVGAGDVSIVSAKTKGAVLMEYSFHPDGEDRFRSALGQISLASTNPTANKTTTPPGKEGFYSGYVADLSSDALLASYYKDEGKTYRFVDYRLVGTTNPIKGKIVPGIVPTIFDSTRDAVLCFTFTEEGTPYALLVEHLKAEERDQVNRPGGRVSVSALLPKGRIITTCLPFRDDDDDPKAPEWGLYQCDPPYDKAKYLGPYRLVGSSRNGQWLLIAHLQTKKAWLIAPSL